MSGTRTMGASAMERLTRSWAGKLALVGTLALLFALTLSVSASAATPTTPAFEDVFPSGSNQVTLKWLTSTDASATHTVTYEIYRSKVPITQSMITPSLSSLVTLVSTVSLSSAEPTWTAVVNADVAGGEVADSYVWFYTVRAKDNQATPAYSAISSTMSPNMHGYRTEANVDSCQRCHNVHGAPTPPGIVDRSSWICYYCHGRADNNVSAAVGDRSTLHTKTDFYDYGTQTFGSQHRSAKMSVTGDNQQCRACHSPHRAPYYFTTPDGTTVSYDPLKSFRMALRVRTGGTDAAPIYTYYSRNDVTTENTSYCFACHGSTTASPGDGAADTVMSYVSTTGFAGTAGDHNEANYATAAHGGGVIYSNDYGKTRQNDFPQVQCLACHDKHASAADKLVAYRGDDTDGAGTFAQAELCYECHSAAGGESAQSPKKTAAGYTAPFSWNGRDVKAQFGKVSHHPTSVPTGAAAASAGTWSQTAQGEFQMDALANTVATAGGSVELQTLSGGPLYFSDGFEVNNFAIWDADPAYWETTAVDKRSGTYAARGFSDSNWQRRTDYLVKTISVSDRTNVVLNYTWKVVGFAGGTDYFRVEYYSGGTWTQLLNRTTSQTAWTAASNPIPSTATQVRFTSSVDSTTEFCYVDDISITSDALPFVYANSGSVVATPITPAGSLEAWGTLAYSETQPGGTNHTVDVLDGSGNLLAANIASGTNLAGAGVTASAIKLRANLTGNGAAGRVVPDDFNDNSFDTTKWNDTFLNSTDPDSGAPVPWSTATEAFASLGSWTLTPSADSEWVSQTGAGNPANCAELRWRTGGSTNRALAYMRHTATYDTSGRSSLQVAFDWIQTGTSANDRLEVEVSTNGSTWTQVWTEADATPGTWTAATSAVGSVPASTTLYVRFVGAVRDDTRYYRVDNFRIIGTSPGTPTSDWPKEASQQLTLRAEGAGFTGTADQGEFTYIDPTQTGATWISTSSFDLRVNLAAVRNNTPQAGLMVRTGTTEADAYATNAVFAGLWPTGGTTANFSYRAAVGGAVTSNGTSAVTLPEWLRLTRSGNTFTAYTSGDGSTWTQVGTSQTVTMSTVVLVGLGTTSATDGSYSEADYDNFSVTETGMTSSATPALNDWTVNYTYFPATTTGKLTCANCHNVHSVIAGNTDETTAANWWNVSRASDPDNTNTNYAGTATAFCLECHDYSDTPTAAVINSTTLVPYKPEFSAQTAPYFPGWNKAASGFAYTSSGHYTSAAGQKAYCNTCHDPHASNFKRLTAWTAPIGAEKVGAWTPNAGLRANESTVLSQEENLCYQCHGNGTVGKQATGAKNVATAAGSTYRHPIATTPSVHSDLENTANLAYAAVSSKRHSECTDCHDPHVAKTVGGSALHAANPAADSSLAGGALYGVYGVNPNYGAHADTKNWTVPSASTFASARLAGGVADYEAFLCFKCHSNNTTLNTATYTDQALEFNPSNFSEHNVLGQSVGMESSFTSIPAQGGAAVTVTWTIPTDTSFFRTGWDRTSAMTCTDCHSNTTADAKGPHGSSAAWIIDPNYPRDWTTVGLASGPSTYGVMLSASATDCTDVICVKCHDLRGTLTESVNNVHGRGSDHQQGSADCVSCHVAIPHGWKAPRLLLTRSAAGTPYAAAGARSPTTDLRMSTHSASGWADADCRSSCAGNHSSQSPNPAWP